MQNKIHLHRTGLVVFFSRILSIFSGLLFLVMVTGWLSPARFGLWEVLLTLVAFASYPAGWVAFWATREVARGRMMGRTTVLLNLILSLAGVVAYLAYSSLSYARFSSSYAPFVVAAVLIPPIYLNQASNAIATAWRPSAVGYSTLVSELVKLLVAYPALFIFKLEVDGVILAIVASYLAQALLTTLLVRGAFSEPSSLEVGRKWLSDSWIPAFYSLGAVVATADTVAASAVTGGTLVAGYYQAAFQIGTLVSYVAFLSFALYPLLLRGESDEAPNATLDLVLMFGIPMAGGVVILAPHLLAVLSPAYVTAGSDVSIALGILAVAGLVTAVSGLIDSTLLGRERADLEARWDVRKYKSSSFYFVSAVNAAYAVFYVIFVLLITGLGFAAGLGISVMVGVWSAFQLGFLLIAVLVKQRRLRRVVRLQVPSSLWRYVVSTSVMMALLYFLPGFLLQKEVDRLAYGLDVATVVGLGAVVYFSLLLVIDQKARRLVFVLLRRTA